MATILNTYQVSDITFESLILYKKHSITEQMTRTQASDIASQSHTLSYRRGDELGIE